MSELINFYNSICIILIIFKFFLKFAHLEFFFALLNFTVFLLIYDMIQGCHTLRVTLDILNLNFKNLLIISGNIFLLILKS